MDDFDRPDYVRYEPEPQYLAAGFSRPVFYNGVVPRTPQVVFGEFGYRPGGKSSQGFQDVVSYDVGSHPLLSSPLPVKLTKAQKAELGPKPGEPGGVPKRQPRRDYYTGQTVIPQEDVPGLLLQGIQNLNESDPYGTGLVLSAIISAIPQQSGAPQPGTYSQGASTQVTGAVPTPNQTPVAPSLSQLFNQAPQPYGYSQTGSNVTPLVPIPQQASLPGAPQANAGPAPAGFIFPAQPAPPQIVSGNPPPQPIGDPSLLQGNLGPSQPGAVGGPSSALLTPSGIPAPVVQPISTGPPRGTQAVQPLAPLTQPGQGRPLRQGQPPIGRPLQPGLTFAQVLSQYGVTPPPPGQARRR